MILLEMLASYLDHTIRKIWTGPLYRSPRGTFHAFAENWQFELLQWAKQKGGLEQELWKRCFDGENPFGHVETTERRPGLEDGIFLLNSLFYRKASRLSDIPKTMHVYLQIASNLLRFDRKARWTASHVLAVLQQHAQDLRYRSLVCRGPRRYVRSHASPTKEIAEQNMPFYWKTLQQLVNQKFSQKADTFAKSMERKQLQKMILKWEQLVKVLHAEHHADQQRDLFVLVALSTWGNDFGTWFLEQYKTWDYPNSCQCDPETPRCSPIGIKIKSYASSASGSEYVGE